MKVSKTDLSKVITNYREHPVSFIKDVFPDMWDNLYQYQKEYMSAEDLPAFAAANKDIKNIKLAGPTEYCMGLKETLKRTVCYAYTKAESLYKLW